MRLGSWFVAFVFIGLLATSSATAQTMAMLDYSTYFGGSRTDFGVAMAMAPDGSMLVLGHTNSFDLPVTGNPYQNSYAGGAYDVFIARFSADLSTVVAVTYLGGNGSDQAQDILVTDDGDVIVAVRTTSTDLPLGANPIKDTLTAGEELYVARLDTSLNQLFSASYVGRIFPDPEYGRARLAAAGTGSFYVAGTTTDTLFPVGSAGTQPLLAGGAEGFILQIDNNCSSIEEGTFIGGTDDDFLAAIHANGSAVWVTGKSQSSDWPVAQGLQDTLTGSSDMILARLAPDLSAIERSTYFGGMAFDAGTALVEETTGDIVVGGLTYSDTLPTAGHVHKPYLNWGLADVFMIRTDADISQLKTVTYYGGTNVDNLTSLDLFSNGQICLGGHTLSDNIPIYPTGFDTSFGGPSEGFLVRFTESFGGLPESSFYGGTGVDHIRQVLVNAQDEVFATGYTTAPDLPLNNPYQDQLKGVSDAFLLRTTMPMTGIGAPKTADIQAAVHANRLVVTLKENREMGYRIFSLDGRLVGKQEITTHSAGSHSYPLPSLAPGMYLISVEVGGQMEGLKWVVR